MASHYREQDARGEKQSGENASGPGEQIGCASSAHKAAAPNAKGAAFRTLQQHNSDQRSGDHEMNNKKDGGHWRFVHVGVRGLFSALLAFWLERFPIARE
jgi:hypothetical protein